MTIITDPGLMRILIRDYEILEAVDLGTTRMLEAREKPELSSRPKTAATRLSGHIVGALAELVAYRLLGLDTNTMPVREFELPLNQRRDAEINGVRFGIRCSTDLDKLVSIRDLDTYPQLCLWLEPKWRWLQILGFTTIEDVEMTYREDANWENQVVTRDTNGFYRVAHTALESFDEFLELVGMRHADVHAKTILGEW